MSVRIKGITYNTRTEKYVAQYWSKDLKTTINIGSNFNTQAEAIEARARHLMGVYDGTIDDSLPKTKGLPKGIAEVPGSVIKYKAMLQYYYGKYNDKKVNTYIGIYDTVEEAEAARKQFILELL